MSFDKFPKYIQKRIPFRNSITPWECEMIYAMLRVMNYSCSRNRELAQKYYYKVKKEYDDLAETEFFEMYVEKINRKYRLNLPIPMPTLF